MDDIIELTDNFSNSSNKANFGDGIELLMNMNGNSNKKGSFNSTDINIEDLNNLEDELNEMVDVEPVSFKGDFFGSKGGGGSGSGGGDESPMSVRFSDNIGIGRATADNVADNSRTWDGYQKFNDIPLNPDRPVSNQPSISKEDLLKEKFKYLKKLESFENKGINVTKKYSMESSLVEMQSECEMIMEEQKKQSAVKFQSNVLMTCINGIEFLNNRFDPFDIKLDGWSDQINENLNDYDDVFEELYEKYKGGKVAHELRLLFQLCGSAVMVHMTNTMFKSAMPGMDDILRQHPDLMKQFQAATINSMGNSNPGFSNFFNNVVNPSQPPQPQPASSQFNYGPPPPPIATKDTASFDNFSSRPGNNNYAKSSSSASDSGSSSSSRRPPPQTSNLPQFQPRKQMMGQQTRNVGYTYNPNPMQQPFQQQQQQPPKRAEMKGPSDINDILSGLKTKTINVHRESDILQQQQQQQQQQYNNDSTISIADLKELQSDGNIPTRSKRKSKTSEKNKNTISIDI
jgi:hypothetical protein